MSQRNLGKHPSNGDCEQRCEDGRRTQAVLELEMFTAGASHDLKAPLRRIRRYLDQITSDTDSHLSDAARAHVREVQLQVDGMTRLIDALVEYTRAGGTPAPTSGVPLCDLVQGAIDVLDTEIQRCGARIEVAPLPQLRCDPLQIQRVFQNLLHNALKYRADRPLHVSVRAQHCPPMWRIVVADNGIGIDHPEPQRAFEPFRRLHADHDGSGLGLATCRRIIERHGGSISVDASPGEGTTFRIELPDLP